MSARVSPLTSWTNQVVDDTTLSWRANLVAFILVRLMDVQKVTTYASDETLAARAGVSTKTVGRGVRELAGAGYLRVSRGARRGRASQYKGVRETLRIVRDSFGDSGLGAEVIEGVGLFVHRYDGAVEEEKVTGKLASMRGGVGGLLSRAELLRKSVGRPRAHCVAAAITEEMNRGRGGKKLPDWWS